MVGSSWERARASVFSYGPALWATDGPRGDMALEVCVPCTTRARDAPLDLGPTSAGTGGLIIDSQYPT
jgi:hypothetical protein